VSRREGEGGRCLMRGEQPEEVALEARHEGEEERL
jgi:hypothetical protein